MSARSSGTSLPDTKHEAANFRRGGQNNPRRPALNEILRDEAPSPWTLEAFTAYSARNFCLENLQFLQEAERYRNAYNTFMLGSSSSRSNDRPKTLRRHVSAQKEHLREMWTAIILNYIAPSSPRELNLPSEIRTALVSLHKSGEAPSPESLQPAVQKTFELIEESILFSFINEVGPPAGPEVSEPMEIHLDSEMMSPHNKEYSSSNHSFEPSVSFTPGTNHQKSVTSHPSQGSGSVSSAPTLTDDTGSVTSPNMSATQVDTTTPTTTPPRTPPASELDGPTKESPKGRNNDTWKRMSMRFLRKKSVSNMRGVDVEKFHA
ncbi:MAG: hypothetical protein M1831_006650 [Alyxoria varia]|nr:MAG: hypothetical protein M1831_006650 [Alyxoria varia]